jgi:pimeloyl-ACP methyl ester carboxylesterase
MTDLHVEHYGAGEPAVLIHGSGSWGVDTFPAQRELGDEFHVLLMDRRGHGQSPPSAVIGWPTDMHDVANLLEELNGAHLAGHSTGGTVALLAAGLRPDLVRSLVVIEPSVWGIADPGGPLPDFAVAQREVEARGPRMSAREYLEALFAAAGVPDPAQVVSSMTAGFSEADWAGIDVSRHEVWAGDAPVDLATLAAASFPKVLAVGAYDPGIHPSTASLSEATALIHREHRALAGRIGAAFVTFPRSAHSPQIDEPAAVNRLLRDTWHGTQRQQRPDKADHVRPDGSAN